MALYSNSPNPCEDILPCIPHPSVVMPVPIILDDYPDCPTRVTFVERYCQYDGIKFVFEVNIIDFNFPDAEGCNDLKNFLLQQDDEPNEYLQVRITMIKNLILKKLTTQLFNIKVDAVFGKKWAKFRAIQGYCAAISLYKGHYQDVYLQAFDMIPYDPIINSDTYYNPIEVHNFFKIDKCESEFSCCGIMYIYEEKFDDDEYGPAYKKVSEEIYIYPPSEPCSESSIVPSYEWPSHITIQFNYCNGQQIVSHSVLIKNN